MARRPAVQHADHLVLPGDAAQRPGGAEQHRLALTPVSEKQRHIVLEFEQTALAGPFLIATANISVWSTSQARVSSAGIHEIADAFAGDDEIAEELTSADEALVVESVVFGDVPNQQESASRSASAAVSAGSSMVAAQAMWASGRIRRASAGRSSVSAMWISMRGCQSRAASRRSERSARSRKSGCAAYMSSATRVRPCSLCNVRLGANVPVKACPLGLGLA